MVFTGSKQAKFSPDVRCLTSLIRVEKEEKRRKEKKLHKKIGIGNRRKENKIK